MRFTRFLFIVPFAVLLLGSDCDETEQQLQVVRDQETRAKVSIAKQNEHIQGLRDRVAKAQQDVIEAESVIVLCWDEQVVDLESDELCRIEAGGFFLPSNAHNGQTMGPYTPPENGGRNRRVYCSSTKIAVPDARFATMERHFRSGCQLIWDEHERRRKIAADKAAAEAAAWRNRGQVPQQATPAQ